MIKYVSAFIFNEDEDLVLLIRKNRPSWQAGLLNAIGGHVEVGESDYDAIKREVKEEAGLDIDFFVPTVLLTFNDASVQFFKAWADTTYVESQTDELLEVHSMDALPKDVVSNINWVLPLSADKTIAFPIHIAGSYPER